ncbi:MAG: prepilin-type N-terminal cleavage/methylation domain-containing protein [Acidobacteria bacterium]|nr:prepilin-type N-terminal cleavage/methylation domain-containing protein [Acidobacteriota bacterium]
MDYKHSKISSESGFSMMELLMVLAIILVLSSVSLFYLTAHQTLYKPDEQALLITDIFQEARQKSLTQRETHRIEINRTRKTVRLIDENTPATVDDDAVIREMNLLEDSVVSVGVKPGNIDVNPPEPLPVPDAVFLPSNYPTSVGDSVATYRFMANGTVTNGGNTATGNGAVVTGGTVHIWSPNATEQANADIARSITVIGSSGSVRLWEYDRSLTTTNKWKDSRRSGTYGGFTGN